MFKYVLNKTGFLIRPFRENLGLFITILYCSSAAIIFFDLMNGCPLRTSFYIGKLGFIISYVTVFSVGLFKGKFFAVAKTILLGLAFVNLATDVIVELTCGCRFNDSVCDLIRQTNLSESCEFVSSYISLRVILYTFSFLFLPFAARWIWIRISKVPSIIGPYVLLPALLYCCFCTEFRTTVSPSVFLLKFHYLFNSTEHYDLREYAHEPDLTVSGEGAQNIVLIIGESMSKSHCSLYSYTKETYPLLKTLNPVVFQNVTAPDRATNSSFTGILNTHRLSDVDEKWYESITIFDLARALSYKTSWLSNQMRYGLSGNVVSDFAALADTAKWVLEMDNYSSSIAKHPDEKILPELVDFSDGKHIEIVHLMGSHEEFSARYPSEFEILRPEDYEMLPANQRQKVSQYDNSMLYNDFVVSEIVKRYDDNDVIFFYFPDHGLDIYESSDSFCGHALANNPESLRVAKNIPFLVFYSSKFKSLHPEILQWIASRKDQSFCADTFIYLLAEAMGITSIDGIDVSDGLK